MPPVLKSALIWLRSVFSEKDGTGSSTRLNIAAVTGFSLGFITALLWKVRAPITVAEFCQGVSAVGNFAMGFGGLLYGVNRAGNWLDNRAAGAQQSQK